MPLLLCSGKGCGTVNKQRPVNLDIGTIKLPITSYVSILHRVSGVILFAVVGLLLWLLDTSLSSPAGFAEVKEHLSNPLCQFLIWGALAALLYHLVAGIRHLIMDMGVGETLEGGRLGAKLVAIVAVVLIVLAGVWVWA
jgi:succinate dehydrogenase / fumarate reductase cytochrome b subunit